MIFHTQSLILALQGKMCMNIHTQLQGCRQSLTLSASSMGMTLTSIGGGIATGMLLAGFVVKLDFRVPKPVQSDDGSTIVKLEDG